MLTVYGTGLRANTNRLCAFMIHFGDKRTEAQSEQPALETQLGRWDTGAGLQACLTDRHTTHISTEQRTPGLSLGQGVKVTRPFGKMTRTFG